MAKTFTIEDLDQSAQIMLIKGLAQQLLSLDCPNVKAFKITASTAGLHLLSVREINDIRIVAKTIPTVERYMAEMQTKVDIFQAKSLKLTSIIESSTLDNEAKLKALIKEIKKHEGIF